MGTANLVTYHVHLFLLYSPMTGLLWFENAFSSSRRARLIVKSTGVRTVCGHVSTYIHTYVQVPRCTRGLRRVLNLRYDHLLLLFLSLHIYTHRVLNILHRRHIRTGSSSRLRGRLRLLLFRRLLPSRRDVLAEEA